MKKKLDEEKGLWAEYLHEIVWSYHTTPHLTTKEVPIRMEYGSDAMIPVEVNSPTWRHLNFDNVLNTEVINNSADLIEEIRRMDHMRGMHRKIEGGLKVQYQSLTKKFSIGRFSSKKNHGHAK